MAASAEEYSFEDRYYLVCCSSANKKSDRAQLREKILPWLRKIKSAQFESFDTSDSPSPGVIGVAIFRSPIGLGGKTQRQKIDGFNFEISAVGTQGTYAAISKFPGIGKQLLKIAKQLSPLSDEKLMEAIASSKLGIDEDPSVLASERYRMQLDIFQKLTTILNEGATFLGKTLDADGAFGPILKALAALKGDGLKVVWDKLSTHLSAESVEEIKEMISLDNVLKLINVGISLYYLKDVYSAFKIAAESDGKMYSALAQIQKVIENVKTSMNNTINQLRRKDPELISFAVEELHVTVSVGLLQTENTIAELDEVKKQLGKSQVENKKNRNNALIQGFLSGASAISAFATDNIIQGAFDAVMAATHVGCATAHQFAIKRLQASLTDCLEAIKNIESIRIHLQNVLSNAVRIKETIAIGKEKDQLDQPDERELDEAFMQSICSQLSKRNKDQIPAFLKCLSDQEVYTVGDYRSLSAAERLGIFGEGKFKRLQSQLKSAVSAGAEAAVEANCTAWAASLERDLKHLKTETKNIEITKKKIQKRVK